MTEKSQAPMQCLIQNTDHRARTRRCFMTGAPCSKLTHIESARRHLHKNGEINAFVIMNYSNMSDFMYKWRLQNFVDELKRFLYLSHDGEQIACVADPGTRPSFGPGEESFWRPVRQVNVIRADSNAVTDYVICSRVCQQMQIADLIIVDVSVENTNVFYEFGMAMSFGKLILPICYAESFYARKVPAAAKGPSLMQDHIGCFPWRKQLFEHYGIRVRFRGSRTGYAPFEDATDEAYDFPDRRYAVFPYSQTVHEDDQMTTVGQRIYDRLAATYNHTIPDAGYGYWGGDPYNTAVLYTMDEVLNGAQAGQCIINFYRNMTLQMKQEHCFCGDRVGILGQHDQILDDPKDTKTGQELPYTVGNILRIGMNQATAQAQKARIKPADFLKPGGRDALSAPKDPREQELIRQIRTHLEYRGIPLFPDEPIYVDQYQRGLQRGILDKTDDPSFDHDHFFCLFHVMVRSLKHTNEIVVDISNNSLQALFWLGAAHGAGISAITVQHEQSARDREAARARKERSIFDVAGLWTAVFHDDDVEGFNKQLEMTQMSIEQRTKLILGDMEGYRNRILDHLYEMPADLVEQIGALQRQKRAAEQRTMEAFYRDCFWSHMLSDEGLDLCLPQKPAMIDGKSGLYLTKYTMDTVSLLSGYLTRQDASGKYNLLPLPRRHPWGITPKHFITIGDVSPLPSSQYGDEHRSISLAEHIQMQLRGDDHVQVLRAPDSAASPGVSPLPGEEQWRSDPVSPEGRAGGHRTELAQLLLWRSQPDDPRENVRYMVSLNGTSGPAVLALASVLVDEERQETILQPVSVENQAITLLNRLQGKARKKFLDFFAAEVEALLSNHTEEERSLLSRAAVLYLSTQLYQYFLPFLSESEERRICSGLELCLRTLEAEPRGLYPAMSGTISAVAQECLSRFRGIDVVFGVDLVGDGDEQRILGIRDLENNDFWDVVCLFV